MKKSFVLIGLFSLFLFTSHSIAASNAVVSDASCQRIFGGGETCRQKGQILLNKTVLNPKTNLMVDNLGVSDPKYAPDFIVTFRLIITNIGKTNIAHLKIKDIFLKYVNFNAGPGNFDPYTQTLSFSLENLKANESRTFVVIGTVIPEAGLPENQEVVCVVNQAIVTAEKDQISEDNAQLCIQKTGRLPNFTTVPTGPEMFPLLAFFSIGLFGFLLRKIAAL